MSESIFNDDGQTEVKQTWITSYADMVTILLIFFIIMISPQAVVSESQKKNMEKLKESLQELVKNSKEKGLEDMVGVEQNGNTARITLKNSLLFDSGSADISDDKRKNLQVIIMSLKSISTSHTFRIQGYTDSVPITSNHYKSNWHLSTDRALSILDVFIENGFEQKNLSAQGFASFRPLVAERDTEGHDLPNNRALNRRVEIHIK